MSFDKVKKLVQAFEAKQISVEKAVEEINKISVKPVDIEWLTTYWNAIDLDEFIDLLTFPEIENWNNLDDESSIKLIEEALENISRDALFQRNTEALERRYSKPEGNISDWIFHDDIDNPNEILDLLKKDATIYL